MRFTNFTIASATFVSAIALASVSQAQDRMIADPMTGDDTAAAGAAISEAEVEKLLRARSSAPVITAPLPNKFRSGPPALRAEGFGRVTRSANGDVNESGPVEGIADAIREGRAGAGVERTRKNRMRIDAGDLELSEDSGRNQRKVVGADDRVRVTETSKFPFTTLGFVYSEFADNTAGQCSGTMIAPNLVLTAAHCIYRTEQKAWATYVAFLPGLNDRQAPFGKVEVNQWSILKGYKDLDGRDYGYDHMLYDIAVLELQTDAGKKTGWLAYGYDDNLKGFNANIIGYPGDKPDGTMWRASCPIDPAYIAPDLFEMECDTYPGSSGSSMYAYFKSENSRVVYGINVASGSEFNYGLRINKPYFDWIQSFSKK